MPEHTKTGSIKYPPMLGTKFPIDMRQYPVLVENWHYTRDILTRLNIKLDEELKRFRNSQAFTVVTAGSFGRMEASSLSDLDFMVLASDAIPPDISKEIIETVRRCAEDLRIELPNPEGVFAQATSYNDLISKAGDKSDTLDFLAQRMLILMEARPIYNETVFRNAVDLILRKYLENVSDEPSKVALFLLNDLIRYFRSICVNYQFNFWRQEDKWALRNIKLRHSRVIMYAGLLLSVLNAGMKPSKYSYLFEMCQMTPLERIVSVYLDASSSEYHRVLSLYEIFLMRLQNPQTRANLQMEYEDRFESPAYREMKVTSAALGAELTRFVFRQRGHWSERVFEAVLF